MTDWGKGWDLQNTLTDIRRFFDETEDKPLKEGEFREFWQSLSEEEKDEFRKTKLT